MDTYRPGDIIMFHQTEFHPGGKYLLVDIQNEVFIVRMDTGKQSSSAITYKDKRAITHEEMQATHGFTGRKYELWQRPDTPTTKEYDKWFGPNSQF